MVYGEYGKVVTLDTRTGKVDWKLSEGDSLWATQDITGEQGVAVLHKDSGERAWT